jgi:hypothetical protein
MVVATPSPVGVNVAVYTVPLPAKLLKVPLDTVTSFASKFVVDSLDVNVTAKVPSFVVVPLETLFAVIVIPGAVPSYIHVN